MLAEVERKRGDYRWLHVWRAAGEIQKGNLDDAVVLLNKALGETGDPVIEDTVNYWNIFKPIRSNEKVNWPSLKRAVANSEL